MRRHRAPQRGQLGGDPLQFAGRGDEPTHDRLLRRLGGFESPRRQQASQQVPPGLPIRGTELDHHAGEEATDQRAVEAPDLAGVLVGGQHHGRPAETDRIEGVQELALRRGLVGEEVHVVDREHIEAAEATSKALDRAAADRGDELVGELLAGGVADPLGGAAVAAALPSPTADALQQMGLADAAVAVEEQHPLGAVGVVGGPAGDLVGEAVGGPHHEVLEASPRLGGGASAGDRRAATGTVGIGSRLPAAIRWWTIRGPRRGAIPRARGGGADPDPGFPVDAELVPSDSAKRLGEVAGDPFRRVGRGGDHLETVLPKLEAGAGAEPHLEPPMAEAPGKSLGRGVKSGGGVGKGHGLEGTGSTEASARTAARGSR